MKRLVLLVLTGLPLMLTSGSQALTINPVVQYTSTSTESDARSFTLGYMFTTTTTFDINALGVWDNGNGDSQEVGIWNSLGTLLVSTTVSGASTPTDGFQWNAVSYVLGPGTYIIGATFDGGTFPFDASGITTQPGYAWDAAAYFGPGAGLNFPNNDGDGGYGNNGILWADFSTGPTVPEPPSLLLLGSGLVGFVGVMRRKLKG